jgi:nitroreductase
MDIDREALYQVIFRRKSVRDYDGPMEKGELEKVSSFIAQLRPLVEGIPTETRVLSSGEVRGMLRADAPHFLAFFSEAHEGYLVNAGFMLQQADLYLSASGFGSCWLGVTKPQRGLKGPPGMEFVITLAFGRPSGDAHRHSISEFDRKALPEISDAGDSRDILEAARLAPSAMNAQPWFFTVRDGTIRAYSNRSAMFDRLNRIDAGIALCHLWLAAAHQGKEAEFSMSDPGDVPRGRSFIASMTMR